MRALPTLTTALCVAFAAQIALAQVAFAAVPVVESAPSTGATSRPPASTSGSSSTASPSAVRSYGVDQPQVVANDPIHSSTPPSGSVSSSSAGTATGTTASTMFQQLQQLQDDVAELRGLVEEQAHQIQQLQADQKEQYLDLDRRMTALKGGAPTGAGSPNGPTTGPTTGGPTSGNTTVGGASTSSGPANSERDAYTKAFNLTKDKRFNEAIAAFNQMLVTYPNGEYAGNAYYWLGEMYRATGAPEKARQSFTQVVNQYPNNAKASDAMYKLGVVYNELGDRAKAVEFLKRVQSQFPGTPAASLAQSYAAELKQ